MNITGYNNNHGGMNSHCYIFRLCLSGTLSKELIQGKIVLCLRGYSTNVEKGLEVRRAGGLGFILQNPVDGISISVDAHVLPGTAVLSNDSATILNYIKSNKNPTARIVSARTALGSKPSPFVAGFSSTGPNALDPSILKVPNLLCIHFKHPTNIHMKSQCKAKKNL